MLKRFYVCLLLLSATAISIDAQSISVHKHAYIGTLCPECSPVDCYETDANGVITLPFQLTSAVYIADFSLVELTVFGHEEGNEENSYGELGSGTLTEFVDISTYEDCDLYHYSGTVTIDLREHLVCAKDKDDTFYVTLTGSFFYNGQPIADVFPDLNDENCFPPEILTEVGYDLIPKPITFCCPKYPNGGNAIGGRKKNINTTQSLKVFPNPFSNSLKISDVVENDFIYIYDALGKLVFQQNVSESNNSLNVNMNGLIDGVYLVNVKRQDKIIFTKRILKN